MKNFTIILLIMLGILQAQAQNYLISFAGTGDTTAIDSIKVYNLTSGASVTLRGGDILNLKVAAGIETLNNDKNPFQVYPNPMREESVLTLFAPHSGDADISISDLSGKIVIQISSFLSQGINEFHISGINQGMYILKATGRNYNYSAKLVSQINSHSVPIIEYISTENIQFMKTTKQPKSTDSKVDMQYTQGDLLLYKSISGPYSTIVTDVPVASKTVTFQFAGCRDEENHTYATVRIGSQIWMAENLNVGILTIDTFNQNANGIIEKYCYENKVSDCDIYGGLYQWGEMMKYDTTPGIQGICPTGWHIPTDAEWTTLMTALGGDSVAGGKMKETGIAHWAPPNTAATNESGFTALPGGYRYYSGTLFITDYAIFWSSTESLSSNAWYRLLQFNYDYVVRRAYTKTNGYSVRCLKN